MGFDRKLCHISDYAHNCLLLLRVHGSHDQNQVKYRTQNICGYGGFGVVRSFWTVSIRLYNFDGVII